MTNCDLMTLNVLPLGHSMTVTALGGEEHIRLRLADLGLCEGCVVRCVGEAPLGDPRAYEVRGAVLALRRRDAQWVLGVGGGYGMP